MLYDQHMDRVFDATAEVVEASVIDALLSADEVTGFNGRKRKAFRR